MTHQADDVLNKSESNFQKPVIVNVPSNGVWRHLGSPPIFTNSAAYQRILRKQQEQQNGAFDLTLGEDL